MKRQKDEFIVSTWGEAFLGKQERAKKRRQKLNKKRRPKA